MARFSRLDILNTILEQGLVPVFYDADVQVARGVARACAAAGCRLLEFTNRGDFAADAFGELERFCQAELPELILGVGSIYDSETAALYVARGANFVVGPIFNADVARFCNRRKIHYLPGCATPSEISVAEEYGCEIVKVFPGDAVGGPAFVKAVLGPSPWTRIMPTGGVDATRDSIRAWFKAGVSAVGIGSKLITRQVLEQGDYAGLQARASEVLGWIREARGAGM